MIRLCQGVDIWGRKKVPEIERVHVVALNKYLKVASQDPSTVVHNDVIFSLSILPSKL